MLPLAMRTIMFFISSSGKKPVEEFLDSLSAKEAQKVLWLLKLVKKLPAISSEYLKKLRNTKDIWEVRVKHGNNAFRLLGFFDVGALIVLTNGFAKKSQKTPQSEITLAEQRKEEYFRRKYHG